MYMLAFGPFFHSGIPSSIIVNNLLKP